MQPAVTIASVTALAVTLLSSSLAHAQGAERGPEREPLRPNRVLLISGVAVTLGAYLPGVGIASTSGRDGDQYLTIPIAGPWVDLAVRGGCAPVSCNEELGNKTLIVASGIAQLAGAAMIVGAFFVSDGRERTTRAAARTRPVVAPAQLGRDGAGVAIVGTF